MVLVGCDLQSHSEGYAVGLYNNYPNWYSSLNFFYYRKDHLGNIREVWCGTTHGTSQRTQYYPSGLPWAEGEGQDVQNKKYNGKEFIEAHGLDEYYSIARNLYPAILRTTTIDPLAEKYYSISPYAWCGNNPVNRIDPDGRDYIITINRDKDGNITGIIFSATVYITGDGANPERAVELNALAKKTYKSKEINGVSVGFDVQYKYDKEVTGIGDYGSEKVPYNSGINMLDLKNEKSDRKNGIDSNVQTEVEGSSPYHGSIYNSREKEISNYDIMHETMHFFGFDDRYNAKTFIYNIGYKNDIMGSRNLNINSSHYSTMYNNVMTYSEIQRGKYPYMKQLNNLYQSLRIPNPFLTTKYSKDTMIE